MIQNHIRGRRRILDPAKKARLCELVAKESYSIEQAADALDVSLRTVQRERKFDQDFDHEVRLSLQQPPDPLKLMEHAARTHWRAAACFSPRFFKPGGNGGAVNPRFEEPGVKPRPVHALRCRPGIRRCIRRPSLLRPTT